MGKDNLVEAQSLDTEGFVSLHKKNVERSVEKHEAALAIKQKYEQLYPTKMSDSYEYIGYAWHKAASFEKAMEYFNKSLAIRLAVYGENHLRVARVYNKIGVTYVDQGKYDQGLDYYQKVVAIRKSNWGEKHQDVAMIYNNIGNVLKKKGMINEALDYLYRSLNIKLQQLEIDSSSLFFSYLNIGTTIDDKGDFDKTLEVYQKALDISIAIWGEDAFRTAYVYNNIGVVKKKQGDYDQALLYYNKALDIALKQLGEDHLNVAFMYYNIGVALNQKGFHDEALTYYDKALKIRIDKLGENHPAVAHVYNNLGVVARSKQNYDQALDYHRKALKIRLLSLETDHPTQAMSYMNIGVNMGEKRAFKESLENFKKALDIIVRQYGGDHPVTILYYFNVGGAYVKLKEFDKAMAYLSKSMRVNQYDPASPTPFSKVINYGDLQATFGSMKQHYLEKLAYTQDSSCLDSILYYNRISVLFEEHIQKTYNGTGIRQFYVAQSIPVYEEAMNYLFRTGQTAELAECFSLSEKTKSRFLSEKIKSIPTTNTFGLPDSLRDQERTIAIDIAFFEKKKYDEEFYTEEANDSLISVYTNQLFDLKRKRENLIDLFKKEYPDYFNLRYSQKAMTVKTVQESLLSDGQVLIEYFVGDSTIFIYAVSKNDFKVHKIRKDFPLKDWVRQMREGIYRPFTETDLPQNELDRLAGNYSKSAYQLYEKLLLPVKEQFAEQSELIIVPDGVLGYVPFDALLTNPVTAEASYRDYPYLLKSYQTSIAYSASLLKEMRAKQHQVKKTRNFLAVAPTFHSDQSDSLLLAARSIDVSNARNRLGALHYNVPEAKALQEIVGGDVLIETEATEAAFVERAGDYKILHLSTHGKANDQSGDFSFLAFYEQADDQENEWLYNRELYELELNADMVVLSACETGIGELQRGEGIISLARGFSYAGAKSIITSLWNVNDQQTPEIMNYFYTNLKEGQSKDDALRQAKLAYLNSSTNPEPYFWAPFIPIGDMQAISFNKGWPGWTWGLLLLASLALLISLFRRFQ